MSTFAGILLLSTFMAVFASMALVFALSMFERADSTVRSQIATERATRLAEPPPLDARYPRLPL